MIINPAKFLASAVGSLTQLLFARGQLLGQLKISKAQQEEAALSFQQTLLNAGSEVNDALTAWQTSRDKSLLLDKQVVSLQKAVESTSLLMEHGTTTYWYHDLFGSAYCQTKSTECPTYPDSQPLQ